MILLPQRLDGTNWVFLGIALIKTPDLFCDAQSIHLCQFQENLPLVSTLPVVQESAGLYKTRFKPYVLLFLMTQIFRYEVQSHFFTILAQLILSNKISILLARFEKTLGISTTPLKHAKNNQQHAVLFCFEIDR